MKQKRPSGPAKSKDAMAHPAKGKPTKPSPPAAVNVLTNRYDNTRAGANMAEAKLNCAEVAVSKFGKVFTRTVDGDLYAQPLIVANLTIGEKGRQKARNVVYLATSRNWVYAYDADHPDEYLPLWSRNLGQPVPRNDIFEINYLNFASEIGVTSTPVIELDGAGGGTMYVVYKIRGIEEGPSGPAKTFHYYLAALDILTGKNRPGGKNPREIDASAVQSDGSGIVFTARYHLNRPGLLLSDGVIYMAFGSHGDMGDFYGWILAYDARTLTQLASYNTAPDWGEGGIWQSGTGLAADREGYVYAVVGNGEKPTTNAAKTPSIPRPDAVNEPVYGNAILKLNLDRSGRKASFKVVDWFTASDTFQLNEFDNDFTGGPVLFDVSGVQRSSGRFIIGGGKDGKIYLGDREKLGQWTEDENPDILQADKLCAYHIHGAPVIWKNPQGEFFAFVWSEKDFLKALKLDPSVSKFDPTPTSYSVERFPEDELRMPGGILAVSANGDEDGSAIVWASHPTNDDGMNQTVRGTLRAYDARNLNYELWNSDMDAEGSDRVGSFAKFCPPVVANGKVYLSTFSRELAVYGRFEDVDRKPRADDLGSFRLQDFQASKGAKVQKSGTYACNAYDLRITGAGLGDDEDSFLMAFDNRDSDTDSDIGITARVDAMHAPQYRSNPRMGLMIRKFDDKTPDPAAVPKMKGDPPASVNPNATRYAAIIVTRSKEVLFLHRDKSKGPTFRDGPFAVTLPCYLRLTAKAIPGRRGFRQFVAEFRTETGTWTTVSAKTEIEVDIEIDGRLMVGLVTTAQLGKDPDTTTDQAHAKFSDVSVVPAISDVVAAPTTDDRKM